MMPTTESEPTSGDDEPTRPAMATEPDRPAVAAASDRRAMSGESNADWRQVEDFVGQLHELSHAPIEPDQYYRRLLEGCVTLLAAQAGTVWLPAGRGRWQPTFQINREHRLDASDAQSLATHAGLLRSVAATTEPLIVPPRSRSAAGAENPTAAVLALAAVADSSGPPCEATAPAIIELFLQPGGGPAVEQGWRQLLTTVSQLASEFHGHHQLRTLKIERQFYDQSLALMQRLQRSTDLRKTAFDIANEGRRLIDADRLSLILREGKTWRLVAASGIDQIETRSDAAQRLQKLAAAAADWGEPLAYADSSATVQRESSLGVADFQLPDVDELPPVLEELIEQHVDESQARRLVAVPIQPIRPEDQGSTRSGRERGTTGVLIAEQFHSESSRCTRQHLLELAHLCEPALRQAQQFDRFPVRYCLRWADHWAKRCEAWRLTKLTAAAAATLTVLAALVFVQCDFEIEAPATLKPLVERDIFATTDGKIVEVNIAHGQQVEANEVLAVLHDPQLLLDGERLQGEIATTRKRLEAIAVARTDRKVREDGANEKIPLSAEAEQLKSRMVSLQSQQAILADRREALTLKSPIAGKVLTLDVQNLLLTRPVQRGQVLFTVADVTSGWQLSTEMPQDRIGQVLAAQHSSGRQLPVRFRLAGVTNQTYIGHVESVSTAVLLDATELNQASLPFEIMVAVDEAALPLARPGMSAQVRIACGRRSLGYVWLHDIWEAFYSYFIF